MTGLEPIMQAIEFAEAHLRAPISVADMADAAAYSLYHFCRMFGKFTRHTPYDYLMRRRMALAAGDVIHTDRRIVDIALDYQFESHEGFTRAFQRMFGKSPAETRRQGYVQTAGCLPRLTERHLDCLQRRQGLIPKLLNLPEADRPTSDNQGETSCLPVEPFWPFTGTSPSYDDASPAGLYGCFTLTGLVDDLSFVLDWALHVWLFYAPYTLRLPHVLLLNERNGETQLCVPVQIS